MLLPTSSRYLFASSRPSSLSSPPLTSSTNSRAPIHTYTHTHTRSLTYTQTQTYTYTHTHTHTHHHTHTRTFSTTTPKTAGHSHYANIKHKKDRRDRSKAIELGKISKFIRTASKLGGPDPSQNVALATHITKAKALGLQKDKIDSAIKSGQGLLNGETKEILFEARGPHNVSMLIHVTTDNQNRATLHTGIAFKKNGGTGLGAPGTSMFAFSKEAVLQFNCNKLTEDEVMDASAEAPIEDLNFDEADPNILNVVADPSNLHNVRTSLEKSGLLTLSAEVLYRPRMYVELEGQEQEQFERVMNALEEVEDISEIVHNAKFVETEEE